MLSAVAATAVLPVPEFVLAEPQILISTLPIELGLIRTIYHYDIRNDRGIVRMDALNGKTHEQFGVDFIVVGLRAEQIRENYLKALEPASLVLHDAIKNHEWLASDMVALPMPRGYVAPDWMHA